MSLSIPDADQKMSVDISKKFMRSIKSKTPGNSNKGSLSKTPGQTKSKKKITLSNLKLLLVKVKKEILKIKLEL